MESRSTYSHPIIEFYQGKRKTSQFNLSLDLCGQPELGRQLQKIAVQLGLEKGTPNPETLEIWRSLI